ncbi:hypothetical protein PUN28_016035 [Cardiocondyla obscurior]|uniref:Uncharacterized protein n=1 Tax=Cardiocondyla obscurior TaxID=286306 RepID=A0AAW2EUD6_9HYME
MKGKIITSAIIIAGSTRDRVAGIIFTRASAVALRQIIIVHRRQEVDEELDHEEIFGTIIVGKLRTSIVTMASRRGAIITARSNNAVNRKESRDRCLRSQSDPR